MRCLVFKGMRRTLLPAPEPHYLSDSGDLDAIYWTRLHRVCVCVCVHRCLISNKVVMDFLARPSLRGGGLNLGRFQSRLDSLLPVSTYLALSLPCSALGGERGRSCLKMVIYPHLIHSFHSTLSSWRSQRMDTCIKTCGWGVLQVVNPPLAEILSPRVLINQCMCSRHTVHVHWCENVCLFGWGNENCRLD